MVADRIADWREFQQKCVQEPSVWKSFVCATGFQPPPASYKLSPMRGDFYFVLDQLHQLAGKAEWNSILVQALGEVAGSFAASYYNWCEARGTVSEGMRSLDRALSKGV
jgi:hypothetical protein